MITARLVSPNLQAFDCDLSITAKASHLQPHEVSQLAEEGGHHLLLLQGRRSHQIGGGGDRKEVAPVGAARETTTLELKRRFRDIHGLAFFLSG